MASHQDADRWVGYANIAHQWGGSAGREGLSEEDDGDAVAAEFDGLGVEGADVGVGLEVLADGLFEDAEAFAVEDA